MEFAWEGLWKLRADPFWVDHDPGAEEHLSAANRRFEPAVHARGLGGGAEQGQQDLGDGGEQKQAVPSLRIADVGGAQAHLGLLVRSGNNRRWNSGCAANQMLPRFQKVLLPGSEGIWPVATTGTRGAGSSFTGVGVGAGGGGLRTFLPAGLAGGRSSGTVTVIGTGVAGPVSLIGASGWQ